MFSPGTRTEPHLLICWQQLHISMELQRVTLQTFFFKLVYPVRTLIWINTLDLNIAGLISSVLTTF